MMTSASLLRSSLFLSLGVISADLSSAQTFDFTLNSTASQTSVDLDYGVTLPGTMIGDYDAVNNPTGTITIPGLFGGSGNTEIGVDLGLSGDTDFTSTPTGAFTLDVSTQAMTVEVSGLELDLLGGVPASGDSTLDILFDSFHTENPTSLYIGGFPVNVPIGTQSISDLSLVQNGPSLAGFLTATMDPNTFGMTVLVPMEISMTVEFFGTVLPVGPLTLPVPFVGEIELNGTNATATIGFAEMGSQTIVDPLPGVEFEDIPFPLPTILPPGGTANLLLTLAVGSLDFGFDFGATLVADGGPACGFSTYCSANPNSTGMTATLAISGSTTSTDQDLMLSADNLPTNVFGIFVMSEGRDVFPLSGSDGFLCLGAPFYRMNSNILFSGATGSMASAIDFNNLPQGQTFMPGSTWNFQLWHRDHNPLPTSNTSPGVTVHFCD